MDFSASHVGFVIAAYGLSALVLIGLIVAIVRRDRSLRRTLLDEGKNDA